MTETKHRCSLECVFLTLTLKKTKKQVKQYIVYSHKLNYADQGTEVISLCYVLIVWFDEVRVCQLFSALRYFTMSETEMICTLINLQSETESTKGFLMVHVFESTKFVPPLKLY